MKKIKSVVLLLLFTSLTAQAGPGGDIWENIALINAAIATLQNQVANIPKGDKGERGEQGIPGEKGATGAPGTYTAGEGIAIEGNVISSNTTKYVIGEHYRGGIIAWLDETKQHGLIASITDVNQSAGVQWRNGSSGTRVTNARGDGVGAGEGNTRLIIAQQTPDAQPGRFAALLAANYKVLQDGQTPCATPIPITDTCYGGWYLPSAYELALIHANLSVQGIATFAPDFYWSSTEASHNTAWMQNFSSGEQIASDKASTEGQVRAVSRF